MVPTEDWLDKNFFKYNKIYFNGKLPQPRLIVSEDCMVHGEDCFGYYNLFGCKFNKFNRKIVSLRNNGTICISSKYDRPEKDIIGTLLHEMIHEYVNLCLLVYPKDPHGKEFMSVAQRINADGWNISEANELGEGFVAGDNDPYNNTENGNGGILCIIYEPNGSAYKYWVCRAEESQFNEIKEMVKSWTNDACIAFYQTNSRKLLRMEANPQTLTGFGDTTQAGALGKLSNDLGENPNMFNINNMTQLWLQWI